MFVHEALVVLQKDASAVGAVAKAILVRIAAAAERRGPLLSGEGGFERPPVVLAEALVVLLGEGDVVLMTAPAAELAGVVDERRYVEADIHRRHRTVKDRGAGGSAAL